MHPNMPLTMTKGIHKEQFKPKCGFSNENETFQFLE